MQVIMPASSYLTTTGLPMFLCFLGTSQKMGTEPLPLASFMILPAALAQPPACDVCLWCIFLFAGRRVELLVIGSLVFCSVRRICCIVFLVPVNILLGNWHVTAGANPCLHKSPTHHRDQRWWIQTAARSCGYRHTMQKPRLKKP